MTTERQVWIITDYGIRRIEETMASPTTERIYLTRIGVGNYDGYYDPSEYSSANELRQPVTKFAITEKSINENTVTFRSKISATSGGYQITELGLYEEIVEPDPEHSGQTISTFNLFARGVCEPLNKPEYTDEDNYGYVMSIDYKLNITSVNLSSIYDCIILDPQSEYIKQEDLDALSRTVLYVEGNLMEQISDNTHILGLNRATQLAELMEVNKEEYSESSIVGLYSNMINSKGNKILKFNLNDNCKVGVPSIDSDGKLTNLNQTSYVKNEYVSIPSNNFVLSFDFVWDSYTYPTSTVNLITLSNETSSFTISQGIGGDLFVSANSNGTQSESQHVSIEPSYYTVVAEVSGGSVTMSVFKNRASVGQVYTGNGLSFTNTSNTLTVGKSTASFSGYIDLSRTLIKTTSGIVCANFIEPTEDFNLGNKVNGFWVFNYAGRYNQSSVITDLSIHGNNLSLSENLGNFELGRQGILPYINMSTENNGYFFANYVDSLKVDKVMTVLIACDFEKVDAGNIIVKQTTGGNDIWSLERGANSNIIFKVYSNNMTYLTFTSVNNIVPSGKHVIVIKFDGTEATLFLNGRKVSLTKTISQAGDIFLQLSSINGDLTSNSGGSNTLKAKVSILSLLDAYIDDSTARAISLSLMSLLGINIYRN